MVCLGISDTMMNPATRLRYSRTCLTEAFRKRRSNRLVARFDSFDSNAATGMEESSVTLPIEEPLAGAPGYSLARADPGLRRKRANVASNTNRIAREKQLPCRKIARGHARSRTWRRRQDPSPSASFLDFAGPLVLRFVPMASANKVVPCATSRLDQSRHGRGRLVRRSMLWEADQIRQIGRAHV